MNSDNVTWIKDGRSIEKNVFASATFVDGSFVSWRIETSLAKTSQRLAKGDLAIPHRICTASAARLERGLLKKKKRKKEKKKSDKGEEIRQLGGGFSTSDTSLAPREGETGKNFQTVQVKNKVTSVSCMNNSKR